MHVYLDAYSRGHVYITIAEVFLPYISHVLYGLPYISQWHRYSVLYLAILCWFIPIYHGSARDPSIINHRIIGIPFLYSTIFHARLVR